MRLSVVIVIRWLDSAFTPDYHTRMNDEPFYDLDEIELIDTAPERYWTAKRILFIIILLITLISFLAYSLFGDWLRVTSRPTPPPPTVPHYLA
ncbi:MAG: hypothetical protein H7175_16320 [Burkholderiales bacterium]|nr:hypothetical protein [Anaerolineae bacterium]